MTKRRIRRVVSKSRRGLVLLLALGMLALFSLLAVTYVVAASSSRAGAQAMKIRANSSATSAKGLTNLVVRQAIRGTTDQRSVFYQHSLLEDVYGQHPIRGRFGRLVAPPQNNLGSLACFRLTNFTNGTFTNLVKLSLFPKDSMLYNNINDAATSTSILSPFENAYNSRLITILEGPLAGQSFRILKYVGYVRTSNGSPTDPNYPSGKDIIDPNGDLIAYSILIDFSEVKSTQLSGTYYDFNNGNSNPFRGSLQEWLNYPYGLQSLFYKISPYTPNNPYGYAFVINDAAFNNAGIGINDVAGAGFGNIDASQVMKLPSSWSNKVSPALLPNYDYLQNPEYVNSLGRSIGNIHPRLSAAENILRGSSNEGYDVPDWRDFWLSHQSILNLPDSNDATNIIPSFHRPELIHFLAGSIGNSSPDSTQLYELVRLMDASSGRVMNYSINGTNGPVFINQYFRPHAYFPVLPLNSPAPDTIDYIAKQIVGPWDVDNDFDGVPDSVWVDPDLPTLKSPDGMLLKPLAAILIQDLDGRINLNTHGDRVQATGSGFDSKIGLLPNGTPFSDAFVQQGFDRPQGLGFGPADISLRPLRDLGIFNPAAFTVGTPLSIFDDRYGIRRTIPETLPGLPSVDDKTSFLHSRDNAWPFSHGQVKNITSNLPYDYYGAPLGVRSDVYPAFDRYGNLAYQSNMIGGSKTNPFLDDAYEFRTLNLSTGDDPFTVQELESILRKFDEDSEALPSRLKEKFVNFSAVRSEISRLLTTRSVELRHPNLVAAMTKNSAGQTFLQTNNPVHPGGGADLLLPGSDSNLMGMQGLIKMLHEQRYRRRSFPIDPTKDDPELSVADINVLFGQEFAQGRKLDLNRAFGNGYDDNSNGVIDEPGEIELTHPFQFPYQWNPPTGIPPNEEYTRGLYRDPNSTRLRLGARQVLARNLYCLAQLIVPLDYVFPGMSSLAPKDPNAPKPFKWYRARARNLAQWAINVVDFRDSDGVCSRFEYDILPFGDKQIIGAPTPIKGMGWAPDMLPLNKEYIGVVWGMEMPELLLTESIALHDKSLRDTDMDDGEGKAINDGDGDMDQYRFPKGSLFLELYAPRTTGPVNSDQIARPDFALYQNNNGQLALNLSAVDPNKNPIWRIGITDVHKASESLNEKFQKPPSMAKADIISDDIGSLSIELNKSFSGAATGNLDVQIGSGIYSDFTDTNQTTIPQFDRMVWFLSDADANAQLNTEVPDLKEAVPGSSKRHQVYFAKSNVVLRGGEFLTLMPRTTTPIGMLARDPRTNPRLPWPKRLLRSTLSPSSPNTLPIHAPSLQALSISSAGRAVTTLLNGVNSLNSTPWLGAANAANNTAIEIATNEPNSSAGVPWNKAFPNGVGLNISMPHPINGRGYWTDENVPTRQLNSNDTQTAPKRGFGDLPPDTWVDSAVPNATDKFKDEPFDYDQTVNKVLNFPGKEMVKTGTYPNVRTAVLQRLADPRQPFDAISNPYLTVDWISIDLTVFNGEAPMGDDDPRDQITVTPDNKITGGPPVAFQSRYKDGGESLFVDDKKDIAPLGNPLNNQPKNKGAKSLGNAKGAWGISYHSSSTAQLRETPIQQPLVNAKPEYDAYFSVQLGYASQLTSDTQPTLHNSATTFGYANVGYQFDQLELVNFDPLDTKKFDGFGAPLLDKYNQYAGYTQDLTSPVWLNRPFATTHELMLVPFTSAARYGVTWNLQSPIQDSRHLYTTQPSFLDTNPSIVDAGTGGNWGGFDTTKRKVSFQSPSETDLALIFDFIETVSPFSDTVLHSSAGQLVGQIFGSSDPTRLEVQRRFLGFDYGNGSSAGGTILPPFNEISTFRAPGKINLNTIGRLSNGTMPALRAIEYLYGKDSIGVFAQAAAEFDSLFFENRKGYPKSIAQVFGAGNGLSSSKLVNSQHLNSMVPTQFAGAYRPQLSAVFAPSVPDPTVNEQLRNRFGVEAGILRSQEWTSRNSWSPSNPRPTPRFSPGSVLTNDTSIGTNITSSDANRNAFTRYQRAMRLPNLVTDQSNVFAVWVTVSLFEYDPITGFGREYTNASGDAERERAFYIIDRTVPVGFIPGEDLNTQKTILLERRISGGRR